MPLFAETQELVCNLKHQPEVLGIILIGSKSRLYHDERSDDDLEVILTEVEYQHRKENKAVEQYYDRSSGQLYCDIRYTTLSALTKKRDSHLDSERWPYEQAQVLYDAGYNLQSLCQSLVMMDVQFRVDRIRYGAVSTTVAIGKAFKAKQRGFHLSSCLVVSRGVMVLARLLFAIEGRWKPTDHWVEKEVSTLRDTAQAAPFLLDALRHGHPQCLRDALTRLVLTHPDIVPNQPQRAILYQEIMRPEAAHLREVHTFF